jgi:hypothetical protein
MFDPDRRLSLLIFQPTRLGLTCLFFNLVFAENNSTPQAGPTTKPLYPGHASGWQSYFFSICHTIFKFYFASAQMQVGLKWQNLFDNFLGAKR